MALNRSMVLDARSVSQSEWTIMREQAALLVKTGFLPQAIKTPEQAVAIMLKARELNIPPMYGLSNISVIQGKPSCNSELMLALIYRDQGDDAVLIETSTNEGCCIAYKRPTWKEAREYTFTMEDAKRAGITSNPSWQKYPAAMLRARCISAVARMAFPDSIAGMYTPEEMGQIETPEEPGGPGDGRVQSEGAIPPVPAGITREEIDRETGEVLDVPRSEVDPMPAPTAMPTPPVSDRPSPVSKNYDLRIAALRLGLGWKHTDVRNKARELFGPQVEALSDLTPEQAEELHDEMDAALAMTAGAKGRK